jgi:hypothetical protein
MSCRMRQLLATVMYRVRPTRSQMTCKIIFTVPAKPSYFASSVVTP